MWKNAIILVLSIIVLSSAFSLRQAMGQPTATPSVQLTTTSVLNQNDTFSTNVTVSNVTDLFGWQVSLYYNSSVLNGTHVDEGPFLKVDGTGTYFIVSNFTDNYNPTKGYILVSCARLGNVAGVNGSGTLATLTFKAVGTGSDVLQFDTTGPFSTELDDSNGNPMHFTAVDEFPALAILPLFMIATLVSLVAFRRLKMARAKPKQ
jgi:hypothetical protein